MGPTQVSFTLAPGYHGAWKQQQQQTGARSWTRTSPPPPPPVFEISTWNHFAPLLEMECDTVIIKDSIVRHVRATTAKGSTILMACTQAELEQQSSQTTSPGHYAPSD
ncbi:hypothetical protein QTP86_023119, partial [Hemibagrus guttatus]